MEVEIIMFPMTKVAAVEHLGSASLEHETVKRLVAWKIENRLLDSAKYRSYGIHYTDSFNTPASQHRVDFCLSFEGEIAVNEYGVKAKVIPALRCARARDIGSRFNNKAAVFLHKDWLPKSGHSLADFPMFFHYVNVGPNIPPEEMITDVYLPIVPRLKKRTINVRFADAKDAEGILKAHFSAVHEIASKDYSPEVLDDWSTPVNEERIQQYLSQSLPEETTLIAEIDGEIAGFGAIVESENELRAVYVSSKFGGLGVGTKLLVELEKVAKTRGCSELEMVSSLTAEPFYKRHGYEELERAQHTLRSGKKMACVKMRKVLR